LTTSLAAGGIPPPVGHSVNPETDGPVGGSLQPRPKLCYQPETGWSFGLFMKQKAESWAENAELKQQISILGSEVSDFKWRIETTKLASSSQSEKKKNPHDLSVMLVSVPLFMKCFILNLQEAVRMLHDKSSESVLSCW